jgi:hypothetical protein
MDKVRGSMRSARFIDATDKGADGTVTGIRQEAGRDEDGTDQLAWQVCFTAGGDVNVREPVGCMVADPYIVNYGGCVREASRGDCASGGLGEIGSKGILACPVVPSIGGR